MSSFNDIDIDCLQCAETFQGSVWSAVHAGIDPELKDLLLGGELNLVACPHCGYVTFQDRFLIYQDPSAELIAYVYPEPEAARETELQIMMLKGFHDAQETMPENTRVDYEPVLFFGLESLIEQLQKEELMAEQSQVAEAICKENKILAEVLKPAHARKLGTPRVLLRAGTQKFASRADVLSGIELLLQLNPALDLYQKLHAAIEADKTWSL